MFAPSHRGQRYAVVLECGPRGPAVVDAVFFFWQLCVADHVLHSEIFEEIT